MKNLKQIIFFLLSMLFLALPNLTHAEKLQCDEFDWEMDCFSTEDTDNDLRGYVVGKLWVTYDYCKAKCADINTFEIVNDITGEDYHAYGKDKNYLFYGSTRLADIEPNRFKSKVIKEGDYYLVYDDDAVWLAGVRYDIFDPETLEFMQIRRSEDLVYLKDKNHIYTFSRSDGRTTFKPAILEGADPEHFAFGYNITDDAVYWYGKRIWEADVESFELMHFGYAKDKNNAYYEGRVIFGADAKSFNELGSYHFDENGRYIRKDGQMEILDTIDEFKQKYVDNGKSSDIVDESLEKAINEYEEKYPNYEPRPAQPGIFTDISTGHPLYLATKTASEDGWINGYPDKSFQPEKSVNRAEFAKMLMIAFEKGDGNGKNLSKFSDVDLTQWYKPYLSKAVELRMMQGYPDGKMRPANTINRAEALKMTLEILGNIYPEKPNQQWYEKYRAYAKANFDLNFLSVEDMVGEMTRGECVELILEALRD